MNHIENDIPDNVDQIQPDNHQSGQMAQDSSITALFARLQPQDVEQFYQSYKLWSITARIQAIQAEIEQVQQEKAANAELLEQYHPSPIAQTVLTQLQSHEVNDSDLLDQMLERGDGWLEHTMQLLEQCEHLDIIHGNYTEWCMHALEGAYDWIGSMHESEAADESEEPAATAEVFDESTEQLLLQKLLSDEEEAIQPEASVEPEVAGSEEIVTSPSPEEVVVETIAQEEVVQTAETSGEEPAAPGESAADNEAEENAPNSEISEITETTESENAQVDEFEESTQQSSLAASSDDSAVLDVDITAPTNISDEAENNVTEIEPEIASGTVEATIQPEEEAASQAPVEMQDVTAEQIEGEQANSEILTELADEEATSEALEQDVEQEDEERETQVESLSEAADSSEVEDTVDSSEEVPVETVAADTVDSSEEMPVKIASEEAIEPASQAVASVADEEVNETTSTMPELAEQPEHEEEVEVASGEVPAEASGDDENDETDNSSESAASPTNEVTHEPVAALDNDIQDDSDLALAESLPTQEESSSDLSLPSASAEIEPVEAEIPHELNLGENDEDTIAIPAISKITFSTGRVTPSRATADAETQSIPTIVPDKTTTPEQEMPPIVEANTIPGLPAITLPPQAIAPSTTSLPDIYGETNKQPAIQQTPAPIWRESSDPSTNLNLSLPQTSSTLLPEPRQNFFLRLWLKFLAWLRGE